MPRNRPKPLPTSWRAPDDLWLAPALAVGRSPAVGPGQLLDHRRPGPDLAHLSVLDTLGGSGCPVLVTTGPADVAGLPIPANGVLVRHVAHGEILPRAAVVPHAGHGTVAAALTYGVPLAYGVPLVCLPNPARNQPALAAQVAALGADRASRARSAPPRTSRKPSNRCSGTARTPPRAGSPRSSP